MQRLLLPVALAIVAITAVIGWNLIDRPVRGADPTVSKVDRIEITDPKGKVTVVIHSDPKPTVEVTDSRGATTKLDLVDLAKMARRFGQE